MHTLTRREFSIALGSTVAGSVFGCRAVAQSQDLDEFLLEQLARNRAPGFSGAVVAGNDLVWSAGYGLADVHRELVMTPETIQNIGSVSKTITATAVMQLYEAGRFDLDDDISEYLPFEVRNPRYPETPVTFRQLLTHRSSIKDGPTYGESYACGDPAVELGGWIEQYFTPGGDYYDGEENFHTWAPGTVDPPERPRAYTNVGFGLLGNLVEHMADTPFNEFCKERIFSPLGMNNTGWMLTEIDPNHHAVPHSLLPDDFEIPDGSTIDEFLPAENVTEDMQAPGSYFPHCLYSFYNYPDGLVRTSVAELSRFLRAHMNGGSFGGANVLQPATVNLMLSNDHYGRGLCWSTRELRNGDLVWGHGGGDPGIATYMGFRERDSVGILMFYNFGSLGSGADEILERLFALGARAAM